MVYLEVANNQLTLNQAELGSCCYRCKLVISHIHCLAGYPPAGAMLELSSLRALKQRRDLLSGVKRPVSGSAHFAPTNDPTVPGEASAPSACSTQRRSSPATSPCPSAR